ncbi:uncharacterized protein LOC122380047 isoform X2 [Amphibalanus amphitrite]|uniref:uncharacterized protein LOC122380047 isoform X2 n=1 Tax=Amphibalanus amphitrite TaxID=1232801 RepID=UPI001C926D55|nr:uncharacterized protein LOC122380047 isoform X2 [Amphibalanus amphitrite]
MKSTLVLLTLVAMAVARPQFGNFGNNFGSNFGGFGRQQGGAQSQVSGLNFGNQGDLSLTGGQALASSNQVGFNGINVGLDQSFAVQHSSRVPGIPGFGRFTG